MRINWQKTTARLLIGCVLFMNLQCAFLFLIAPASFALGFELDGSSGSLMVRSMGILFIMWNIPYGSAFIEPLKHRISLVESVLMQAIGLAGECLLLATLPTGHAVLRETAARFIWFDGGGLLLLLLALYITLRPKSVVHGAA